MIGEMGGKAEMVPIRLGGLRRSPRSREVGGTA